MAVPPQLILAAMQMMKNRKSTKDQIKEALAPATDALKNDISPLVSMSAKAGTMYNLRAEDPNMRTGIATGAIGGAADGFQAGGLGGLFTGGILGGLGGAIATGNAKEQKEEQGKYTYLNQMYGSVVGEDYNLQSLLYAEEGGEIISPEGEVFVPIQTEAKKIGNKLVKEKLIFSDGKIADVNATKPHSEQKKDDVTDITVEGTYVMPVSTKLSKKDLDSLINYSTSNYSENGKNFGVEKITLRNILGDDFEGSFAEATDIVTKKYPVADNEDDLDPIARVTNNENIANRSKIIAHLMRLNEAKINKEPIVEEKLMPDMKAKVGGFVKKYVLGSTVSGNPIKPKTALEKRKDKYDQNKPKPVNKYTLKAYEPESKAKKIYKALVAPVSTMDNRSDTSYEDPNGLDIAIGAINPFAWIDGTANIINSTKKVIKGDATAKDYGILGVSAAASALGLKGIKDKSLGEKVSRFIGNIYNPIPSNVINKKPVVDISNFNKENEFYRVVVGDDAFNDIVQTGTVRTKQPVDKILNKEGTINLDRRGSTPYPSFSKGKASIEYAKENPNNYIIVTADESIKPSIAGRHGKGTTMFPTDKEGKHMSELAADKVKVYKHIGDGKYELVEHIPSNIKKMSKGGYIRKMAIGGFNGGPTVPIIPEKWRDIWAIDETGQAPYYQMPTMAENPFYNMSPIDKISNGLPVTDENPYGFNGQTAPIPNGATPSSRTNPTVKTNINPGETEMLDEIKSMISERSGDAIRDAEESKKGYKDLSRRVGMRDLMQLGNSLIGIGLQDRSERRSFKRPLYIDQKYRGLSPQQINQESEAATGAGVEMVKNMLNAGGDRVTARLAPILVEKLISQQGRNRKAYVDQNTQLEMSKYDERGAIQQFNLDEEQKASRVEQDNTNKAIAGTSNVFNKYISSRSDADISKFKVDEGINRDLTDKLYQLENQQLQADIIGKDYEMQMPEINKKIADIEFELNRTDIDAAQKASLKSYQDSLKRWQKI